MHADRIQKYLLMPRRPAKAVKAPAAIVPPGFAICPPGLAALSLWQQQIYRMAYEKARRDCEVPRHYRRLFSVWN